MTSLLQELQALELELHHPGVRCDRERLGTLLHPEFHEVGRSGHQYDRDTVISQLSSHPAQSNVVSDGFAVVELCPQVALLTYRSAHIELGDVLGNHALRSSLWVKSGAVWQLRYHQGTAAAQTW
ncbi:MAG: nuclear transport factor 2 family protein [Rubrivivax sp.]|nr:nuclear transport factor 2 family protein [Rubrivivax sp.]